MDECHRLVKPTHENSESKSPYGTQGGYVLVIGATNRPHDIDPALRRPGRFAKEIVLGVPDEKARAQILSVLAKRPRLDDSFDLLKIARSTPGFVGADLESLGNEAGTLAMARITDERESKLSANFEDEELSEELWNESWPPEDLENLSITMADLEQFAWFKPPQQERDFSDIPDVKWENVGGLDLLRHEFDKYIIRTIKYPEEYEEFKVKLETEFLLYGPPGFGKTLRVKAVANEAGANFIHIKGPELLNKYVGESKLEVGRLFRHAGTFSPCRVFFDDNIIIDLLQLCVFIRSDVIDNALLRSGRFCKCLYVPLPSPGERGLILKALMKNYPVDLNAVGRMEACDNFSGADLAALANEAGIVAGADKTNCTRTIKMTHFELASTKRS
ncbi:Spastin [Parasponia andersonii]|uniref:Spastin n=1 Tax=Parasponia andersonii TaxID=3476 RepID=A0A2P5ABP5_PARAD|nr:Spastin [Parasponia andersonii]